eukprot:SM000013S26424  [mRNA]  locus=s13:294343:297349:+ [translate_table: standard]
MACRCPPPALSAPRPAWTRIANPRDLPGGGRSWRGGLSAPPHVALTTRRARHVAGAPLPPVDSTQLPGVCSGFAVTSGQLAGSALGGSQPLSPVNFNPLLGPKLGPRLNSPPEQQHRAEVVLEAENVDEPKKTAPERPQLFEHELKVASQAVQLACQLSISVQEKLLSKKEKADTKKDKSLVTVADWGVQAVVAWLLSQYFPGGDFSMVAEEDTEALKGRQGVENLQRVVIAVNECLAGASKFGLQPPLQPLGTVDVLKAINRGTSRGGPTGRHWILDPVDGTLGFTRGDQYAIALAMMEDGEVVLGALGCPNLPMRAAWLRYPHRYFRLTAAFFPPKPGSWYMGCVMMARQGGGTWMEPLVCHGHMGVKARQVRVSSEEDPAAATFCEPVEKANSSQSFTAGLADSLGLRNLPLRVYSMAKYAAIARGDAEIFMKFARAGYKEKIWDHAAGVLIVQEAGGIVTDAGGRHLDFSEGRYLDRLDRGIIACGSMKLHASLTSAVEASWDSSRL